MAYRVRVLKSTFFTDNYFAVVDRSFFPKHPEFISAYWIFIVRIQVIVFRSFIAKVNKDLQSVFAAEVCGGLGVLLSILKAWKS